MTKEKAITILAKSIIECCGFIQEDYLDEPTDKKRLEGCRKTGEQIKSKAEKILGWLEEDWE